MPFSTLGLIPRLAGLLSLAASISAYANPGACTGDCLSHDPSLVRRKDGQYFRFSTGNKITIYQAPSLTGPWVNKGAALPHGSSINLKGRDDLWAPDVTETGGKYTMYYAVSSFGSQNSAIGFATSPTMEPGSWTDHGHSGISSGPGKPYNAIDPNHIQVGSSRFLTFGSFWSCLHQVSLNGLDATNANAHQVAFTPAGAHSMEGAFVYKHGGFYYLFYSLGQCCGLDTNRPKPGEEYKIMVCRASGPAGPYEDKNGKPCTNGGGTVVLASHGDVFAPGGQGVMQDPDHGDVLYYHYANTKLGLADNKIQFGWNTISWKGGWPTV